MKQKVIHSHDGAADDQLALTILLQIPTIEVIGIIITNADCYLSPALEATLKILKRFRRESIPIGLNFMNINNRFPDEWRKESFEMNASIEETITLSNYVIEDGVRLFLRLIENETEISVCETGPLNFLARAIQANRGLIEKNVKKIVWMGGCFEKSESCTLPDWTDGTQSWNAFADSESAKEIFDNRIIPLTLSTADITDKAIITKEFYNRLPSSKSGNLFKKLYSNVKDQPYYRMWDVLTAMVFDEAIAKHFSMEIDNVVMSTKQSEEGTTIRESIGKECIILLDFDREKVYNRIIELLNKN